MYRYTFIIPLLTVYLNVSHAETVGDVNVTSPIFINSINEQQIYSAFGKLQTQPKQDLILLPLEKPIEELLERGNLIERDPAARIAWWQSGPVIHLFCNGEHGVFSYTDKALITLVSETQNIALATVSSYIQQKACKQLLIFLADVGYYGTSEY